MISSNADATMWRKSRRCESQNCVEVAEVPAGGMAVRNSTLPDVRIAVEGAAWQAFVARVRRGDFDSV